VMNRSLASLMDEPDLVSDFTSTDILELISDIRPVVEKEKNLIEADKGRTFVVGDIHGDFGAIKYIFNLWKEKNLNRIVFLGDYVDRGSNQLDTINFLLSLKLLYPETVYLLRGNHETPSINSYYGFSSVCIKKFGKKARRLYNEYNILFSYFSPAFLFKRVLLVHGGIPKGLNTLEELNLIPKGDLDADNNILGQILWNDPSEYHYGFELNWARGIHYTYGEKVFSEFLEKQNISMVVRSHEVFPEGYKYFFDQNLLSIFSSPSYRMGNKAKIAELSEKGEVTLIDIKGS
jgi:predicted phosphodiesterase